MYSRPFLFFFIFYRKLTSIFLFFSFIAHGFVFNRTPVCESKSSNNTLKCVNLMTGVLTLRNEETSVIAGSTVGGDTGGELRIAQLHDPSRRGILITLEKSAVRFVYDLHYEMDAFSEFYEDMYEYTYPQAGQDPGHFCYVEDVERCAKTGEIPRTPEGYPLLSSVGRCCWCLATPLYASSTPSGGSTRNGHLKCSAVDVIFKRSVWVTRSCPRIRGPWYTGMRIGPWRWDFAIRVRIEWYSPPETDNPEKDGLFSAIAQEEEHNCLASLNDKNASLLAGSDPAQRCSRLRSHRAAISYAEYTLNVSVPELYDEQRGIKCRITGSMPQTDAFPPSLDSYHLFFPTYPLTDPLVYATQLQDNCGASKTALVRTLDTEIRQSEISVQSRAIPSFDKVSKRFSPLTPEVQPCLSNVMLIPSRMVDPTGLRCDVIGTSFRSWAQAQGRFCDSPPGMCMGNQLGTLRREDEQRLARGHAPKYLIGAQRSLGSLGNDPLFRTTMETVDLKSKNDAFYFSWNYLKEHITSLELSLDVDRIVWITSPSPGEIESVRLNSHCNALANTACTVMIRCRNTGFVAARYLVTVPYCVDKMSRTITDHMRPVAPSGVNIEPNATQDVHITLETTQAKAATYTCKAVLLDSDGRRLDQTLFNVTYNDAEHIYQGAQLPAWNPEVNVSMSDVQEKQVVLGNLLDHFKSPLQRAGSALYEQECRCRIFNVACVFANFFGCVARAKAIIVSSVGVVSVAASMYVFGPSIAFCLKFSGHRLQSLRQTQQSFLNDTCGQTSHQTQPKMKASAGQCQAEDKSFSPDDPDGAPAMISDSQSSTLPSSTQQSNVDELC